MTTLSQLQAIADLAAMSDEEIHDRISVLEGVAAQRFVAEFQARLTEVEKEKAPKTKRTSEYENKKKSRQRARQFEADPELYRERKAKQRRSYYAANKDKVKRAEKDRRAKVRLERLERGKALARRTPNPDPDRIKIVSR